MNTYQALNLKNLYDIEEMNKKGISCWLLYQICNESGTDIRLMSPVGPLLKLRKVLVESFCYILYNPGEDYRLGSLTEQGKCGVLDIGQLLLKEGFDINPKDENDSVACVKTETGAVFKGLRAWRIPQENEVSEIVANNNGFCVFYPIDQKSYGIRWGEYHDVQEEQTRRIEVCYRPNTKKLQEAFLEGIFCNINLQKNEFDYKQYFAKTLEDEKMFLNKEESLELYDTLEKNARKYIIDGGEIYVTKKETSSQPEIYRGANKIRVRDITTQNIFLWWINGRIEKQLNKAVILGLLE